jgi:pimeloyl-ACP methyl ester carboxylesterase
MSQAPERPRFHTSGGELEYTDVGEGPAVVLLHGFPLSALEWRRFVPMLAARFRVIAPDLLGAGASDKPLDRPQHIRAQAGYVRELLAHLGISSFAVVGHATGGGVAQLLALDGAGVEAMVLIDATSFDHWPSEGAREVQARSAEVEPTEQLVRALIRTAFDVGGRHRGLLTDELVDAYAAPYLADPAALFRAANAIDGVGLVGREAEFAALTCPVLILWGEDDPFFPVLAAEHLNEAIDSSTLGLLPGCGHFLPDEAPETIAPLIAEYLRAMYLKAPHGHAEDKPGVVMLQLERRPPWVDLAEDEADDWFVEDDEEGTT